MRQVRHGELLRLIPLRSALYNARMPNKRFQLTRAEGALTRKPGESESPCNGVTEAIRIICEAHTAEPTTDAERHGGRRRKTGAIDFPQHDPWATRHPPKIGPSTLRP